MSTRRRTNAEQLALRDAHKAITLQAEAKRRFLDADAVARGAQDRLDRLEDQISQLRREQGRLEAVAEAEAEKARIKGTGELDAEVVRARRAVVRTQKKLQTAESGSERERQLFAEADTTRDAALLEQDKRDAQAQAAHALIEREAQRDAAAADARIERDIAVRRVQEARAGRESAKLHRALLADSKRAASKMAATQKARGRAQELTQAMRQDAGEVIQHAEQVQAKRRAARTASLLTLRDSLTKVEDETAARAARNRAKRAAAEEAKRAESAHLVERGTNPYEEFRRRKMRADEASQQAQLQKDIEASQRKLASQIVKEDAAERIAERAARRRAKAEHEYIAEVGRDRKAQKAEQTIRSMTMDGRPALDPGGRLLRVLPSELAAPQRTHKFGTGMVGKDPRDVALIAKEAGKRGMEGVRPDPHVLRARLGPRQRKMMTAQELSELEDEEEAGMVGLGTGLGLPSSATGTGTGAGVDQEDMGGGMAGLEASAPGLGASSTRRAGASATTAAGGGVHAARRIGGRRLKDLSKLEQKTMAKALDRQKSGIVRPQVAAGRVFDKGAFTSKPRLLAFIDYRGGTVVEQKVTLTNSSYSFASFRVGDAPDELRDLFTPLWKPQGRMSAGTSAPLRLRFEVPPGYSKDLEFELPVLSSTGPCNVPVRCSPARAVPALSPLPKPSRADGEATDPVVSTVQFRSSRRWRETLRTSRLDLGAVVVGQDGSSTFRLHNHGAIPFAYRMDWSEDPHDTEVQLDPEALPEDGPSPSTGFVGLPPSGEVPAYSSRSLRVHFKPRGSAGLLRASCLISSQPMDGGDKALPEERRVLRLEIQARALALPLYAPVRRIDLRTCLDGKAYRALVILKNAGPTSLKCRVEAPAAVKVGSGGAVNADAGRLDAVEAERKKATEGGIDDDMALLEQAADEGDEAVFGSKTVSAGAMAVLLEKKRKAEEDFTQNAGMATTAASGAIISPLRGRKKIRKAAGPKPPEDPADLELLPKSFYVQGREEDKGAATLGKPPGSVLGGTRASRSSRSEIADTVDGEFQVAVILRPTVKLARKLAAKGLAGPVSTQEEGRGSEQGRGDGMSADVPGDDWWLEVPLSIKADSLRRPVRVVLCARVTPAALQLWAPMKLPPSMPLRFFGSPAQNGVEQQLGGLLNPTGYDAMPGRDDAGTRRARASGKVAVEMGECMIGQAVERPLVLFNPSTIAVRYGFVKPGRGVSFDGDGLGVLLPRETAVVSVRLAPSRPDENLRSPVLQSSTGQRLGVSLACTGIEPLLTPSATRIALPPLAVGDEASVPISLRAGPKQAAKFEVQAPQVRQLLEEAFGADGADAAMMQTLQKSMRLSQTIGASNPSSGGSSQQQAGASGGGSDVQVPEAIEVRPAVGRVAAGDTARLVLSVRMTRALARLIEGRRPPPSIAPKESHKQESGEDDLGEAVDGEEGVEGASKDATYASDGPGAASTLDGGEAESPSKGVDAHEQEEQQDEESLTQKARLLYEESAAPADPTALPLERQRVFHLAICETLDDRRSVQDMGEQKQGSGAQGIQLASQQPPLSRSHALELAMVLAPTEMEITPTSLVFGACPVGGRQELSITLRNRSPHSILPAIDGLADGGAGGGDVGGFSLSQPPRVLRPGQKQVIPVVFQPRQRAAFATSLFVRWARADEHREDDAGRAAVAKFGTTSRRIRIMGKGDSPSLAVDGWPTGGLSDFGALRPGAVAKRTIILRSSCSFPVEYTLVPAGETPGNATKPLGPFSISSYSGTVSPGQQLAIEATFAPDSARMDQQLPMDAALRLVVKHQDQPPRLWRLQGRCVDAPGFVVLPATVSKRMGDRVNAGTASNGGMGAGDKEEVFAEPLALAAALGMEAAEGSEVQDAEGTAGVTRAGEQQGLLLDVPAKESAADAADADGGSSSKGGDEEIGGDDDDDLEGWALVEVWARKDAAGPVTFAASCQSLDPYGKAGAETGPGAVADGGSNSASPRGDKGKGGKAKGKGKSSGGGAAGDAVAEGGGFQLQGASGELQPGEKALIKVRAIGPGPGRKSAGAGEGVAGGGAVRASGGLQRSLQGMPAAMKAKLEAARRAALAPDTCGLRITGRRWGTLTVRMEGEDGKALLQRVSLRSDVPLGQCSVPC